MGKPGLLINAVFFSILSIPSIAERGKQYEEIWADRTAARASKAKASSRPAAGDAPI